MYAYKFSTPRWLHLLSIPHGSFTWPLRQGSPDFMDGLHITRITQARQAFRIVPINLIEFFLQCRYSMQRRITILLGDFYPSGGVITTHSTDLEISKGVASARGVRPSVHPSVRPICTFEWECSWGNQYAGLKERAEKRGFPEFQKK